MRDRQQNPPPSYAAGVLVSLRIPKKNRMAAQNTRLLCQVLGQTTAGQYELQTEYGILSSTFPAAELDLTSSTIEFTLKVLDPTKKITLNFASKQERLNVGLVPVLVLGGSDSGNHPSVDPLPDINSVNSTLPL